MADQRDLARKLVGLANDDLAAVRTLSDAADVSDAIVGFHAQQAVEKALKAVLSLRAVEFPFTHDLEGLAELCEDAAIRLPAELERIGELTPYGVRFRYGGLGDDEAVDIADALWLAHHAVTWAAKVLADGSNER